MDSIELLNFFRANGVEPADFEYLGTGDNGSAWRCGDFVVKQTSSIWEYEFALKQLEGEWPLFAKMYAVTKNDAYYFYIAEFLQKDDDITSLFSLVDSMLAERNILAYQAYLFNYESYLVEYMIKRQAMRGERTTYSPLRTTPLSKATEAFFYQIVELSKEYKRIGANDLHDGNLGYDKNGVLKAFDLDIDADSKTGIMLD
jgi:hypothetical protein